MSIEEYDDLDFGKVSKLYLRGVSIKTAPHEGMETKTCETKEEYLQGLKGAGTNYQGEKYNYPIVKIFNNIWIRENYKHEVYVQPHRDWKVNNETLKRYIIEFLLQSKHVQVAGDCLTWLTIRTW